MTEPSYVRRVLDTVERWVEPPLTTVVNHESVVVGLALAHTARAQVERTAETASRRLLHLYNLPAGSDITRLLQHIAAVEREVRRLNNRIDDLLEDRAADRDGLGGGQRP